MSEGELELGDSLWLCQARLPAGTATPNPIAGKVSEHRVGADRHLWTDAACDAHSVNGGVGSDPSQGRSAQAEVRSCEGVLVAGWQRTISRTLCRLIPK